MSPAGSTGPAGYLDMQAEHTVDITEVFAWSGKLARDPAPPVQVAPAPAPAVQGPAPGVQVAPAPAPGVQVARAPDRAVPALDAEQE